MRLQNERFDALSHFWGVLLSAGATVILIIAAIRYGSVWHIVSYSVFGATLILLYGASTLYHMARMPGWRERLQRLDHAMIFVLIAGTYTPFSLTALRGGWGWSLFGVVWSIALLGLVWKMFGRQITGWPSLALYVGSGWLVVIAFVPLMRSLAPASFWWLVIGGVAYTLGAILLGLGQRREEYWPWTLSPHNLFHILVLFGSLSHVLAVLAITMRP